MAKGINMTKKKLRILTMSTIVGWKCVDKKIKLPIKKTILCKNDKQQLLYMKSTVLMRSHHNLYDKFFNYSTLSQAIKQIYYKRYTVIMCHISSSLFS